MELFVVDVTLERLKLFIPEFLGQMQIESLIAGNITKEVSHIDMFPYSFFIFIHFMSSTTCTKMNYELLTGCNKSYSGLILKICELIFS